MVKLESSSVFGPVLKTATNLFSIDAIMGAGPEKIKEKNIKIKKIRKIRKKLISFLKRLECILCPAGEFFKIILSTF
jgi:hypothetical protein